MLPLIGGADRVSCGSSGEGEVVVREAEGRIDAIDEGETSGDFGENLRFSTKDMSVILVKAADAGKTGKRAGGFVTRGIGKTNEIRVGSTRTRHLRSKQKTASALPTGAMD